MTYRELFYKATRLINHHQITLGEYEEMTKPLDREVKQEPKIGHWKYFQNEKGDWMNICSNCNSDCGVGYPYDYCPNCGAEMKGDVEE